MTSRSLYSNLLKENLKRRIWIIAMGVVTFFFALPVSTAMRLSDSNDNSYVWYSHMLGRVIGTRNQLVMVITCIMAVVFAIQGFSFLFSKSKVDLYHSVPVKREKLFAAIFLNGILIYFVAYVINLILSLGIIALYGMLSMDVVGIALVGTAVHLVYFFSIYSVVVLAVMLTGNIIVAFLGSMVLLFYVQIFISVLKGYAEEFFVNYSLYSWRSTPTIVNQIFSPVNSYFHAINMEVDIVNLLWSLLMGIALSGISMWLYKKRASEAAERSMAFSKVKLPVKVVMMILVSLGGGLLFYAMVSNYRDFWLVFGVIIGLALSQSLIEIIYEYDVKAAGYQIKKIWIPTAAVAVIICIFRLDTFGYDSYLPAKEKLESVSLSYENDWDLSQYYFKRNKNGEYSWSSESDYKFEQMQLTDMGIVYPLLESAAKAGRKTDGYYPSGNQFIMVKYKLKNGKEKYRSYTINQAEQQEVMDKIFQTDEYKEGAYPALGLPVEEVTNMPFYWIKSTLNMPLDLSPNEKEELLAVYKEELSNVDYYNTAHYRENLHNNESFNSIAENTEIGIIQISVIDYMEGDKDRYSAEGESMVLYVYPEFVKTLELIEGYIK